MVKKVIRGTYSGQLVVPPSKSDAQRAILAAALTKNETHLVGVGKSADEKAMLRNIETLGAVVRHIADNEIIVHGIQEFPDYVELNAGESGLGVRLLTAVCAANKGVYVIRGEGSLVHRPQGFFEDHLVQLGVKVRSNNGKLPIEISGRMRGGYLEVDGSLSSQFLSGLLMGLPLLDEDTELLVHNLKSIPYVCMTIDTLQRFGVYCDTKDFELFHIKGGQSYHCKKYRIESDWSSASYWLVAAALGHKIRVKGLSLASYQADMKLLNALENANCAIVADDNEIVVDGTFRKAFSFDATHCPDLFPALVTLAAFCDGDSYIFGVHRLKNKESDRGAVLKKEFEKLGLAITITDDAMVIHGGVKLVTAEVDAHNDHRIAMCLAIAGLNIKGGLTIVGAESVDKSYPEFWDHLEMLERN